MIPSRLVLPSMSICRVVERVRWDEVEVEVDDVGVVGIGAENREEPRTWIGNLCSSFEMYDLAVFRRFSWSESRMMNWQQYYLKTVSIKRLHI